MKYRTLARKESPSDETNSPLSELLRSFATIDTMLAPSPAGGNVRNGPKTIKRTSSVSGASSSTTQTQKQLKESMSLLDSVAVEYPYYQIPEDLLRFIPDTQLKIIEPFIKSPDEFIKKKKYVTNVDERSYLTVFEYQINENWIIWDYNTGYVFFTGLWKTCGNNKTDIVKIIDKFPNINSDSVKRVRGGFLKIQGTWLPYEIVKDLCKKFCFNIRYCLIPLFGEHFPESCLKPTDSNFGRLTDLNPYKRRRRASTNSSNVSKQVVKFKKSRSKSDSVRRNDLQLPLLELEEVLKASKQLHDLSASPTRKNSISRDGSKDSFNYGGFTWLWRDGYDLKILGKDHNDNEYETAVVDDNYEYGPGGQGGLNIHSASTGDILESIPKNYDGFDTLLKAAHQLVNIGSPDKIAKENRQPSSSPTKGKMDIGELLS
jgi:hypothetical protein